MTSTPAPPSSGALRDTLGLTGTKFGCGAALCGACTVHLDGQAIRSCIAPISAAEGKKITTIEATTDGSDRVGAAVHTAWVKHDVAQCGYCQSGQIMSATAFLKALPRGKQPTAAEIDAAMAGNICRWGTYAVSALRWPMPPSAAHHRHARDRGASGAQRRRAYRHGRTRPAAAGTRVRKRHRAAYGQVAAAVALQRGVNRDSPATRARSNRVRTL